MEQIQKDQGKVLLIASLTEFGERYSYYVIQSLLIFFLIREFHISQEISSELVGTVLSMVYISAIISGYIADKLIGYYVAAFIGSLLMAVGTLILSISASTDLLFLGLAFISISIGLIKSNISSFLGSFYDRSKLGQGYRDFGFNIFYVGINLGSVFALFFASTLRDKYGFAVPFYSCVVISLLMISNIIIGFFKLKNYIIARKLTSLILLKTIFIIIMYMILVFIILKNPIVANIAIFVAAGLSLLILFRSTTVNGWKNPLIATCFFLLSILYWSIFFQIFISVLLFIDSSVNHQLFSFHVTNSQFLSFEAAGVILFGAVLGKFWLYRSKLGKAVHDLDKFNLGFILLVFAYSIFYIATIIGPVDAKVPACVIIFGYLFLSFSELCLSAIGLSLITKIAPQGFVSLYMGIWLVTLGIGGKLAGLLGKKIVISQDIIQSKINMAHGFLTFILIAAVGVVLCIVFRKTIMQHLPQNSR